MFGRASVIGELLSPLRGFFATQRLMGFFEVTFTARTYAVYCQNRFVLVYLAALGLATIITDAVRHQTIPCVPHLDLMLILPPVIQMHVPNQQCFNSKSTPL